MPVRYAVLLALAGALILAFFLHRSSQRAPLFDTPLETKRTDLGVDPDSKSPSHVTCLYFDGFLVKELDTGNKGAEQISIVPIANQQRPPCQRENVPAEIVLEGWSGYVDGVKSPYLFLSGDDGFGLEFPFAVYDVRSGKKLFDDAILEKKPFEAIEVDGSTLTLRYPRVVQLDCSVFRDPANPGGEACWNKHRQELQLEAPAPDCSESYRRSAADFPADPSQLAYDVVATWDGSQFRASPAGTSVTCGATP